MLVIPASMGLFGDGFPGADTAGYSPAYALQFDGSADYLSWIPSTTSTDQTKFQISFWHKRTTGEFSGDTTDQAIFFAGPSGGGDATWFYSKIEGSSDGDEFIVGTNSYERFDSPALFRDPSAWSHYSMEIDTTNSTAGNRIQIYKDGYKLADDTSGTTDFSAGDALGIGTKGYVHTIGKDSRSGQGFYLDGYLAEFILLDGVAPTTTIDSNNKITSSPFGEFDSATGIWVPKDPTSSDNISDWGGQNSLYLNFADGNNPGKDAKPTAITANPGTYKIDKSLWFDSSSTHGLTDNATPASDSNKKMTMSCWVKRAKLGDGSNSQVLWSWTRDNGANDYVQLSFLGPSDKIGMTLQTTDDGHSLSFSSNAVYRDTAAWMHILFTVDTTVDPATYDIWVNGVSIKNDLTHGATPAIAQNQTFRFGETGSYLGVGCKANDADASELDGYMADVAYLNNVTVTDASDFGGFDANGIWMPKDISGLTYGSSSFLYQFGTAPGSTNGAGTDTSGRGNHLTENDTTATRQTTDSPTNTAADNEGNFATLNPLASWNSVTFIDGSLKLSAGDGSQDSVIVSTLPMLVNTYFEWTVKAGANQYPTVGITDASELYSLYPDGASRKLGETSSPTSIGYERDGTVDRNGSAIQSYTALSNDDVGMCAYNPTTRKVWFGRNGTWNGDPAAGSSEAGTLAGTADVFAAMSTYSSEGANSVMNFGQTAFAHTPPTGFKRLHTGNMTAVTIDPRAHFAPVIYTGTGFSRTVRGCFDSTGTAWTPDLVWLKNRDTTDNHAIWDSVRGVGKAIHPNLNVAEQDNSETNAGVTAFNSGGFSLGNFDQANTSTEKYVAWSWKIGGSPTVENDNASGAMDDGSVFVDGEVSTSYTPAGSPSVYPVKMSINTTTKMSLLTYKAGSASSIPHGLGVKPNCIFIKNISSNKGWRVGFFDYDGPTIPDDDFGFLDSNGQFNTSGNTDHLASGNVNTFSIDGDNGVSGNASWTHLAWCMASVEGFSKFGTYTGNGDTSANGPFIYLGFKPSWVMLKRTDAANNWGILDASRNSYNPVELVLYADLDQAEAGSGNQYVDFTSTGFKIKNDSTANWINASSGNYVYAAFAETPFANNNRGR